MKKLLLTRSLWFIFGGLIVYMVLRDPRGDSYIKDVLAQKNAEIASLEHDLFMLELKKDSVRETIITRTKYVPVIKEIVRDMPPMRRDSMFYATTDTVNLSIDRDSVKVKELVTIEPFRITAANMLFAELGVTKEIVLAQSHLIGINDSIISKHEERFVISKSQVGVLEDELDITRKELRKQKRKNTFNKILVPAAFVVGLLL
jgi:hypothetical protein